MLSVLKPKQYDIVFLQETHLSVLESEKLCKEWGHVFCSVGPGQRMGVVVRELLKVTQDTEGRQIIISAEIQS